jgi:hypothetical protein
LRRLRLDRLLEPLDASGGSEDLPRSLDAEGCGVLEIVLGAGDEELASLLCDLFRLRSVRALREGFDESDQEIASAMRRAASALLAGHSVLV